MKSWKTTLFGFLSALGVACASSQDETLQTIGKFLAVICPALTGYFAKDSNVTGGTNPQ